MYQYENLSIKSWAEEDRPREKLLLKGKSALSDAELIGILIGSGTPAISAVGLAQRILAHAQHDLNQLAKLNVKDLMKFPGIGEAKAISIVSALELGRRRKQAEPKARPRIRCASEVFDLMRPALLDLPHEEFWVLLLNRRNELISKKSISSGGVAGTVVDPKIIFKYALEELASFVILIHNHPSGNLQPSNDDKKLTKRLKEAGVFMEIPVLDHLIFTDNEFFSFADQGLL